ncbi:DUF1700 domain-containing protein [Clostridium niameyense]|nr:DUF1700 domain-containing protein [Clostridium niameyense]
MNNNIDSKGKYLDAMQYELSKNNVTDIEDIIDQFKEHFDLKMLDGYTEQEIIKQLLNPKELALQYEDDSYSKKSVITNSIKNGSIGVMKIILLIIPYMAIIPTLISVYITVFCGFIISFSGVLAAFSMLSGITFGGVVSVPHFPIVQNTLVALICLCLSVCLVPLTYIIIKYLNRISLKFANWTVSFISGKYRLPVLMNKVIKPQKGRVLRNIILVSLFISLILFVALILSMLLQYGSVSMTEIVK